MSRGKKLSGCEALTQTYTRLLQLKPEAPYGLERMFRPPSQLLIDTLPNEIILEDKIGLRLRTRTALETF